jgi:hypothetical protein
MTAAAAAAGMSVGGSAAAMPAPAPPAGGIRLATRGATAAGRISRSGEPAAAPATVFQQSAATSLSAGGAAARSSSGGRLAAAASAAGGGMMGRAGGAPAARRPPRGSGRPRHAGAAANRSSSSSNSSSSSSMGHHQMPLPPGLRLTKTFSSPCQLALLLTGAWTGSLTARGVRRFRHNRRLIPLLAGGFKAIRPSSSTINSRCKCPGSGKGGWSGRRARRPAVGHSGGLEGTPSGC